MQKAVLIRRSTWRVSINHLLLSFVAQHWQGLVFGLSSASIAVLGRPSVSPKLGLDTGMPLRYIIRLLLPWRCAVIAARLNARHPRHIWWVRRWLYEQGWLSRLVKLLSDRFDMTMANLETWFAFFSSTTIKWCVRCSHSWIAKSSFVGCLSCCLFLGLNTLKRFFETLFATTSWCLVGVSN